MLESEDLGLLEILAQAEDDVKNGRVAPITETFDALRADDNLSVHVSEKSEFCLKKAPVDWDSFVIPSQRGQHVDEYMREMRDK